MVVVTPGNDTIAEGLETVILTLAASAACTIGSPSTATITIADNDLPTVTITAADTNAAEIGPDPGTFTLTRTGPRMAALTVNYTIGGTATNTIDYTTLSGTATIAVGQSRSLPPPCVRGAWPSIPCSPGRRTRR